jgi:hypothetical protein
VVDIGLPKDRRIEVKKLAGAEAPMGFDSAAAAPRADSTITGLGVNEIEISL